MAGMKEIGLGERFTDSGKNTDLTVPFDTMVDDLESQLRHMLSIPSPAAEVLTARHKLGQKVQQLKEQQLWEAEERCEKAKAQHTRTAEALATATREAEVAKAHFSRELAHRTQLQEELDLLTKQECTAPSLCPREGGPG